MRTVPFAETAAAPTAVVVERLAVVAPIAKLAGKTLCGTEVRAPEADARNSPVPVALRSLGAAVPAPAELLQAYRDFGLAETERLDLAGMTAAARASRAQAEAQLAELPHPPKPGVEAPWDDDRWSRHIRALLHLGRADEAVAAAEQAHALLSGWQSVELLVVALDAADRARDARRLLERELTKADDPEARIWLSEHLGYQCATQGDDACAARAERAISAASESLETASLAQFLSGVRETEARRFDAAAAAYAKSASLQEDYAVFANVGELESCRGRPLDARRSWERARQQATGADQQADILAGMGYSYLVDGDTTPAWLLASSALVATGNGPGASRPRGVLALAALGMGDLDEARNQVRMAHKADPHDDLERHRCFTDPTEGLALRAMVAEARGDSALARGAWLQVARSRSPKLGTIARRALAELCA